MGKYKVTLSFGAALILVVLGTAVILFSTPSFNQCTQEYASNSDSNKFEKYISALRWCSGEFMEMYEGPIVGFGTLTIALFTAVLSFATILLWRATQASIDLAAKEFMSTQRPKIIVRSFERTTDASHPEYHTCIMTYVNAGNTDAKITEIAAKITPPDKGILKPGLPIDVSEINDVVVTSGEEKTRLITSQIVIAHNDFKKPDYRIFCVGFVTYEDGLGRKRKTGFCRRYDPNTQVWVRE